MPEPPIPDAALLYTQSPPFSVPDSSGKPKKRPRTKASHIHEYVSTRGCKFVCDRCSRAYESRGGTGAISRNLSSIDTTATGASRKTTRERLVTDAAVYREPKNHTKVEEARETSTPTRLSRATLPYFSWVKSKDQYFALVNNMAYRNLFQYIRPVAYEILPDLITP